MNTTATPIIASAPGTLMLTGEHAVLYGYPALVCAVDQRITVTLNPRDDDKVIIHSPTLGTYQATLTELSPNDPFKFVLTAIMYACHPAPQTVSPRTCCGARSEYPDPDQAPQQVRGDSRKMRGKLRGFDLTISSDFSHQVGLGSSAAVTVATLAALSNYLHLNLSLHDLYQQAYQVIQSVQQIGSGADVAASVYGGVVYYQREPFLCQKLLHTFPIALIYSGSKKPTPEVVALVKQLHAQQPEIYQNLFKEIGACTQAAVQAINAENWPALGEIFNRHQKLQAALGVTNPTIESIIELLLLQNTILGAKISGAGLGDCVIAIGSLPDGLFPHNIVQENQGVQQLSVKISTQGVAFTSPLEGEVDA
jgi:mevalonate kinase